MGDIGAGEPSELSPLTVSVQYRDLEVFRRNLLSGDLLKGGETAPEAIFERRWLRRRMFAQVLLHGF